MTEIKRQSYDIVEVSVNINGDHLTFYGLKLTTEFEDGSQEDITIEDIADDIQLIYKLIDSLKDEVVSSFQFKEIVEDFVVECSTIKYC